MDTVEDLRHVFFNALSLSKEPPSTPVFTSLTYNTVIKITELREAIFLQLPLYDLLMATQICKEWQDFILSSPKLRGRLLHEKLSFYYAARISQSETERRNYDMNSAYSNRSGYPYKPMRAMPELEYLLRIPQRFVLNKKMIEGTLIVLHCNGVRIKLPVWEEPGFQLPAAIKAHLYTGEVLFWGAYYRPPGCSKLHAQHNHLHKRLNGQKVEQREYLEKHLGELLQEGVCEDEDCVWS